MLQFCSDYASDNNILFNPIKSQCLKFCKYVNNANLIQFPVSLHGIQLTWTDHIIHLGHHLSATLLTQPISNIGGLISVRRQIIFCLALVM